MARKKNPKAATADRETGQSSNSVRLHAEADAFAPVQLCVAPGVRRLPVELTCDHDVLGGDLYLSPQAARPVPAFVLTGPFAYVREQSPRCYATRLVACGYAALAFDCRTRCQGGGAARVKATMPQWLGGLA